MKNFIDSFSVWFDGAPLRISTIILIALLIRFIGARAITKAMDRLISRSDKGKSNRVGERARTIGALLRSSLSGTTALIALATILDELGINLGPLLTSAGVVGVALGLGAQTFVRDLLAGLSMLLEDQYGVGDEVELLEVKGIVENVGLRITTVRAQDGVVWYLRNGEILKVGNRSQ
jgi:small-conductance mechanosensitive channel